MELLAEAQANRSRALARVTAAHFGGRPRASAAGNASAASPWSWSVHPIVIQPRPRRVRAKGRSRETELQRRRAVGAGARDPFQVPTRGARHFLPLRIQWGFHAEHLVKWPWQAARVEKWWSTGVPASALTTRISSCLLGGGASHVCTATACLHLEQWWSCCAGLVPVLACEKKANAAPWFGYSDRLLCTISSLVAIRSQVP